MFLRAIKEFAKKKTQKNLQSVDHKMKVEIQKNDNFSELRDEMRSNE
jgi:hypothetical protein